MNLISFLNEPQKSQLANRIIQNGMTIIGVRGDTRSWGRICPRKIDTYVKVIMTEDGRPICDRARAFNAGEIFLQSWLTGSFFSVYIFWNGQQVEVRYIATGKSFEDTSSDFFNIPRARSTGVNKCRESSRVPFPVPPVFKQKTKGSKPVAKKTNDRDTADRANYADCYMAREMNRFGSMPGHDNYGEESTGNECD